MLTVLNLTGLSVRSSQDQRTLGLVMDRLALAVTHGLPLATALRSLPAEPELAGGGRRAAAWCRRLGLLAGDLEAGNALSSACERRLAALLPLHFVPALRCAEEADCVVRALPLLARNLKASARARQSLQGACVYPLVQFTVLAAIMAGLLVFVVPKLVHVFGEMLPGVPFPLLGVTLSLFRLLADYGGLFLAAALIAVLGVVVARRLVPIPARLRRLLELICRGLPVLGGLWRRYGLVEAAGAVAGFLAAGADIGRAARWAAGSVRTEWARDRLTRFAAAVEAGAPWADAWTDQAMGSPLCAWLVRNAAAREQPREGFQAVAEWALDDLNRRLRCLVRWAEPAMLLGNAVVVAAVIFALIGTLFSTIYAQLGI